MIIRGNNCKENAKGNWVYLGRRSKFGKVVYVGTTMQKPSERFRHHRHNGKDLIFSVVKNLKTPDEMLDLEVELIKKHSPELNKKVKRHNDNRKLSVDTVNGRIGDSEWCQSCLKRRTNNDHKFCYWCGRNKGVNSND